MEKSIVNDTEKEKAEEGMAAHLFSSSALAIGHAVSHAVVNNPGQKKGHLNVQAPRSIRSIFSVFFVDGQ